MFTKTFMQWKNFFSILITSFCSCRIPSSIFSLYFPISYFKQLSKQYEQVIVTQNLQKNASNLLVFIFSNGWSIYVTLRGRTFMTSTRNDQFCDNGIWRHILMMRVLDYLNRSPVPQTANVVLWSTQIFIFLRSLKWAPEFLRTW